MLRTNVISIDTFTHTEHEGKCALVIVSPTSITFLYAISLSSVKNYSGLVKGRIPSRVHGERRQIDTVQFGTSLKKA